MLIASPRTLARPKESAIPFSGSPSNSSLKCSDQLVRKPHWPGAAARWRLPPAASPRPNRRRSQDAASSRPRARARWPRRNLDLALGASENRRALAPATPFVMRPEIDAKGGEPPQPRAQQRRSLEAGGEDAPARADEGRLAEAVAPGAQRGRGKAFERLAQARARRPVTREQDLEILRVGDVEAAAAGNRGICGPASSCGRTRVTRAPAVASTSAAIRPAGPAPITIACAGSPSQSIIPKPKLRSRVRRRCARLAAPLLAAQYPTLPELVTRADVVSDVV